jgi:CRP/FNR family transcriptional regulator, cyclic AMP receptor protein
MQTLDTTNISDAFPLLSTANAETLELLVSVAVEHEYPAGRAVLMEDAWGNAVYFVVNGWVKVRRHGASDDDAAALAILGRGDFFGEMAVLDESPRSTDVVSMTQVKLLSIPAQQFVKILFNDPNLHHRMLQLMVRRLRQTNYRFQLRDQPPAVKLVHTLVTLADAYGTEATPGVVDIVNLSAQDLADLADISLNEAKKILTKLIEKAWIKPDSAQHLMHIQNMVQMSSLLHQVNRK